MNIGIIIPTTTNNTNWKTIKETHLYNIFLKSFLHKMCPKYNYRIYLGIDSDDKIYSKKSEIDMILKFQEVFKNIKIIFVDMKGIKKGWVTQMWNRLFKNAYDDGCKYFYQCGDDIHFFHNNWITQSIEILKKNNDIGLTGPLDKAWIKSCNGDFSKYIHTQAFVSRKHMEIFGFFFPKAIKNWYCDNWITQVYLKSNCFYRLDKYHILNLGGKPRYTVVNKNVYGNQIDVLIKRGIDKLKNYQLSLISKTDLHLNNKWDNSKHNICLCFCVRNCGKYLASIFKNIQQLIDCKFNITCIFVYDNCKDNSGKLLQAYKNSSKHTVIVKHIENTSRKRTCRIAKARNTCLDIINNDYPDTHYHIMIDADNINQTKWDVSIINKYINNFDNDDWDCITFNRNNYYDIWALLIDDFKHHCWGFGSGHGPNGRSKSTKVMITMKKYIKNKLKTTKKNSIDCLSAFNGFAIYKTEKCKGISYDGNYKAVEKYISDKDRKNTEIFLKKQFKIDAKCSRRFPECCEHIYYHLSAKKHNNCKIKISKFKL